MSCLSVEHQYRRFLLIVAAGIFAGSVLELSVIEHAESWIQMLPFGLAAVGTAAVGWALLRPSRPALLTLRGVAALVALGSLFGIYEHLAHNFAFELEIRPNATAADVFWDALAGATPMLAPGILALGALLAAAATYRHPALTAHPSPAATAQP